MKEELTDSLIELERRLEKRREEDRQYYNERLQILEAELEQAKTSALQQELRVLNSIGKNIGIIEGDLQNGLEEIDLFFKEISSIEMRKGKIGCYEDAITILRKSHKLFSLCHTEIQTQKMQWNQLVERLLPR